VIKEKIMISRSYRVGQILYVLTHKETKIYPIQVIEEIIKRTVSGESVSYIAKVGKNAKTISLSEVDGDLYEDIEDLRKDLTNRVMNTVNNILDSSALKAEEWYPRSEIQSPIIDPLQRHTEKAVVVLPDGKVANLKLTNVNEE
jgi:hypothetical protein